FGSSPNGYGTSPGTATDDHSADSLAGGAGNDIIDAGLGDDTSSGGLGDDTYVIVPGSADVLTEVSGGGTDTVDYSLAYQGISFSLASTAPQKVYAGD